MSNASVRRLASTFIQQVLEKREQQQRGLAVVEHRKACIRKRECSPRTEAHKRTGVYLASEGKEQAEKWMNKTMKTPSLQMGRKSHSGKGKRRRRKRPERQRGCIYEYDERHAAGAGSRLPIRAGVFEQKLWVSDRRQRWHVANERASASRHTKRSWQCSNYDQNRSGLGTPGGSFCEEPSAIVTGDPFHQIGGQMSRNKPFRLDAEVNCRLGLTRCWEVSSSSPRLRPLTSNIVAESSTQTLTLSILTVESLGE